MTTPKMTVRQKRMTYRMEKGLRQTRMMYIKGKVMSTLEIKMEGEQSRVRRSNSGGMSLMVII